MNYEDHCIGVGRLWGKLQSLEVTLRIFLTQANPSKNYITSRDTFGTLVEKYNSQLSKDRAGFGNLHRAISGASA